jgi:hypothetical protein
MPALDNLVRHLVNNRRSHRRRHFSYEATAYDESGPVLFRGKTRDLSRSGAQLTGLPLNTGIHEGQQIILEFFIPPRKVGGPVDRLRLSARIMWMDEGEDSFRLGVRFDRELAE